MTAGSGDETFPTPTGDIDDAVAFATGGATAPGGKLGRFIVVGVLGAGGMGVVLQAFDPELNRKVAIKVLHSGGAGTQARGHLQREARAMAKLSHPNAVTVYEVDRAGDHLFIAMELVEGTTLKAWLTAEKRPWRDVVEMFVGAGRGLTAVHESGLVHRDFKPENVLLGKDGRPRVSDFGIAEMGARDAGEVIVGTPAYMAPEQWLGAQIDARSDQFSFCVTFWQALQGTLPFDGDTPQELRAAVIAGRRRSIEGNRGVPRWLGSILDRGLATEPAARWPSMAALLDEIDRRASARRRAWMAAGGLALVVASGGGAIVAMTIAGRAPRAPAGPATAHFASNAAQRVTFNDACEEFPAFSPDGKTVYFDGQVGADAHLFAADTATWTARELTQTDGWDFAPSVSPDGRRLAFVRRDETGMSSHVADILPDGDLGPSRQIASGPVRPVWSPDGHRVWGGTRERLVSSDLATGAERRRLVPPNDMIPVLGIELRDGRFVMLGAPSSGTSLADTVFVFPPDGGSPRKIFRSEQTLEEVLVLAPEGDAVFVAQMSISNDTTELVRVPLDGGPPVPMGRAGVSARKQLAISTSTGRAVWSDCKEISTLAAVQTEGGVSHLVDLPRGAWGDTFPRRVPGTTRLLFLSDRTDGLRIWEIDRARPGPARRIPFGDIEPIRFAVSRDGAMVAGAEGSTGLWVGPVDGSVPPRLLAPDPGELSPTFSYDGTQIYFERAEGELPRIAVVPVAGGEVTWVAPAPSGSPASSPVDDRLAYLTHAGGVARVRILDPKTHQTRDVTLPGPQMPWDLVEWSSDGTRLLVVRNDAHFVELDVATGKTLRMLKSGADMFGGATYVKDEIIVGRTRWIGDLWTTDVATVR